MIRSILPVTSPDIIKELLSIDRMYDTLCYDNSPELKDFEPKGVWFLLLYKGHTAGFIKLDCMNNVLWSPHIFIFDQYRGNGSEEWGKQVAKFMKENCGAKKFLALTPYLSAKLYAEKVGFKQVAVLEESIQKNGKLMNQYVLEMK